MHQTSRPKQEDRKPATVILQGRKPGRPLTSAADRSGRRRARAHQCRECRRPWAFAIVEHAMGQVVQCRLCGTVRDVRPARETPLVR